MIRTALRSVLVTFVSAAMAGCATTDAAHKATAAHPAQAGAPPPCRTRARALSSTVHRPGAAALAAASGGWAVVWAEALGTGNAIRFLPLDAAAQPTGPGAEVADLAPAPTKLAVSAADAGYLVTWQAGARWSARTIDGVGRPRGDIEEAGAQGGASSSSCRRDGDRVRCTAPRGVLELPAGAEVRAEHVAADGAGVIAADGAGLSLYVLACSAP